MNELLTNERENIYKKPWNKLELGMKLVKLKDFQHSKEASENLLVKVKQIKLQETYWSMLVNLINSINVMTLNTIVKTVK